MLRKETFFGEDWLKFWGICGEAELFLDILGAKAKYFKGAEEIIFRDLGTAMHYL